MESGIDQRKVDRGDLDVCNRDDVSADVEVRKNEAG